MSSTPTDVSRHLRLASRVLVAPTAVPGVRMSVSEFRDDTSYRLTLLPGASPSDDTILLPGVTNPETLRNLVTLSQEPSASAMTVIDLSAYAGEQWLTRAIEMRDDMQRFVKEMAKVRNSFAKRRRLADWGQSHAAGVLERLRKMQGLYVPGTSVKIEAVRAEELLQDRSALGRLNRAATGGARRAGKQVSDVIEAVEPVVKRLKALSKLGGIVAVVNLSRDLYDVILASIALAKKDISLETFNKRVTSAAINATSSGVEVAFESAAALCFRIAVLPVVGQVVVGVTMVSAGIYLGSKAAEITNKILEQQLTTTETIAAPEGPARVP